MDTSVVISGSGMFVPAHTITNDELVASYNDYAEFTNAQPQAQIEAGEFPTIPPPIAYVHANVAATTSR